MDASLAPDPLVSFLGALAMLAFCVGAAGLGDFAFRRFVANLDPAARFGVSGLLGLGAIGTVILFVGLVPGGASIAWVLLALAGLSGLALCRPLLRLAKGAKKPAGPEWLAAAFLGLAFLFALIVLLAPSTAADWDSIAYHMALPKLYMQLGHIERIRFASHSAFPEAVELLFLLPLKFGLQSGAKAVLLGYSVFGSIALFGLARERYGRTAGWWAAVGFMATPVVLWESSSAYIDVAHGLFAGLAVIFGLRAALEKRDDWVLAGLLLGLACGTKYTGLQVAAVLLFILIILALRKRIEGGWRPLAVVAGLALLVGGPWYVKNIVAAHNPVYPFLYERFGGVDWDQKRADIYRDEQLSFGVGVSAEHKDWTELGHAIFGLAYQPGRYVNPMQAIGGGNPLGAIGLAAFAGLLFWSVARRPAPLEGGLLAFAGLSLVLWFALSQQSRYAVTLAVPASLLLGGAVAAGGIGRLAAGLVALQALFTLWLFKASAVDGALPVDVGKISTTDYLHSELAFSEAAEAINALPGGSKVALYDQVFGYYLNRSYAWANPGHSTMIPYDSMRSGADLVRGLRANGFTHIYVQFVDRSTDAAFETALAGGQLPLGLEQKWRSDWTESWKVYLIEAIAAGQVQQAQVFKGGMLFEIRA